MFAAFFYRPPRMKAGDGNRTHVACLEGRYSTIELHPRFRSPRRPFSSSSDLAATQAIERMFAPVVSAPGRPVFRLFSSGPWGIHSVRSSQAPYLIQPNRSRHGWSRIRTCEGIATRFTVWPLWPLGYPPRMEPPPNAFGSEGPELTLQILDSAELAVGLELTTLGLQNRCSTD
jgi:hypothetical protein